jgi:hypothetical protein
MACCGIERIVLVAALLCGCAAIPRYEASGEVAGHRFEGPVDCPLAQSFLTGAEIPRELEALRLELQAGREPTPADYEAWSRAYSPDVATLLFVESLAQRPEHVGPQALFDCELDRLRRTGASSVPASSTSDVSVLFVPGWFYASHGGTTGADLRRERALLDELGIAQSLVPLDENGTVQANAVIVAECIREASATGLRVVIVSASKSSAEVALALGALLERRESAHVVAWLSVGGAVRGSPLADRVLQPDLAWLAWGLLRLDGYDMAALRSLRASCLRPGFDALRIPKHILKVSYLPVPLSGNVDARSAFGYRLLRRVGPTDGLTLLDEQRIPGGLILIEPGADHFFEHRERELRTAALLNTLRVLASRSADWSAS